MKSIGIIGMGTMGKNLSLNLAEKGVNVSIYNRSWDKTKQCIYTAEKDGISDNIKGYKQISELVNSLQMPRKVLMLVKAGNPVDETMNQLVSLMDPKDIIIDGGNEWYENTQRRINECMKYDIDYLGMGISGGKDGARNGASFMPGGSKEAYDQIKDIFELSAAMENDQPCISYIGAGGSGNFVKMIHNGIEYADMQLLSEVYYLLKYRGFTNEQISYIFQLWNRGYLKSYLLEISSKILNYKKDSEYLIDLILDRIGSKGTGKWSVQEAAELQVPASLISTSLDTRYISQKKSERMKLSKLYNFVSKNIPSQKKTFVRELYDAYYCSKICIYSQGLNIIREKSIQQNWNIDLSECVRIWKNGCIIRGDILDYIQKEYKTDPELYSLLYSPFFMNQIKFRQTNWRTIGSICIEHHIPSSIINGSISYFDTYTCDKLPSNLVEAQRDYFGNHGYERIDKKGIHYSDWK